MDDKKIIAEVKSQLQYPMTLIEIMMEKRVNRNKVPMEFFDDAMQAFRKIKTLLNKLARWEE